VQDILILGNGNNVVRVSFMSSMTKRGGKRGNFNEFAQFDAVSIGYAGENIFQSSKRRITVRSV
jgi:hypothetical protein